MSDSADIVARITQNINGFQRSKVKVLGPLEVVAPAARVGDIIHHTSFWTALAGAFVGAAVTVLAGVAAAAAVGLVIGTGGAAAPFILGAIKLAVPLAIGFLGGTEFISKKATEFINEVVGGEPSGPIVKGSPDVKVNGKPLAMVDQELSVACTRHSPPQKIAQGSETVTVNNQPVARKGDKTECSATIAEGSPNVFIGSGRATYVEMKSEFTGWQRAVLVALEFVVPPTALFGKGIGKVFIKSGKSLATRGAHAGTNILTKTKNKLSRKTINKTLPSKVQQSKEIMKDNKRKILKNNSRNGKKREIEVKHELIDERYEILGSQVSVKTQYTRRVIDHLVKKDNEIKAIEVKHGKATRSPMQVKKDNSMEVDGGEIIGKNAPDYLKGKKIKIKTEVRR